MHQQQRIADVLPLLLLQSSVLSTAQSLPACNGPGCNDESFGLEDGRILDVQLTASSTYPAASCALTNARLHHRGAWCAEHTGEWAEVWVQIDLGRVVLLTAIASQGRSDFDQWVTAYSLRFSNDSRSWSDHVVPPTDRDSPTRTGMPGIRTSSIPANNDRDTPVFRSLEPGIRTRYVRVLPRQWHTHPCLRLELYGSVSTDGMADELQSRPGTSTDRAFQAFAGWRDVLRVLAFDSHFAFPDALLQTLLRLESHLRLDITGMQYSIPPILPSPRPGPPPENIS